MKNRDLFNSEASDRASSELETVIKRNKPDDVKKVTAEEAMQQPRVFQANTGRNVTRVLFISQDSSLLNPETQSLDGYLNLADLFDEVHILIVRQGITPKNPVFRVNNNVWIYTAAAWHWLLTPHAGIKLAEEQLVFASGFRPDLIVARDPFESAIVAYKLADKFNRPAQVHILEDYQKADFIKKDKHNFWRRYLPRFTLKKFQSIRTATDNLEIFIKRNFSAFDIKVLPRFQNYETLISLPATLDLKDKYKSFVFIILYVGKLGHESTAYKAIDAARFVLRNPRVGMVIIGDGPARSEFQKRTQILGIDKQVVFEPRVTDPVPYLKSANLLIVTDTTEESDDLILQAAACGIPMIMTKTEKRNDLFINGESGYLCDENDIQAYTDSVDSILNNFALRGLLIDNAQTIIREKFHYDPNQYKEAYRSTIEQAMFLDEQIAEKNSQQA